MKLARYNMQLQPIHGGADAKTRTAPAAPRLHRWLGSVLALLFCQMGATGLALADEPAVRPPQPGATAPAAPAAAAEVGTIVIDADADDLVAEVKPSKGDPRMVGLKKGENRVEVPAGPASVVVTTKSGRAVATLSIDVAAAATQTAKVVSRGKLIVQVPADAEVTLDDKPVPAQDGQFAGEFEPGAHSLVVQRDGHFGQRGSVSLAAGKTATVATTLQGYDPGGKATAAWVAMIGGGVLLVGTLVVDATTKWDEFGGDVTRWTMFSVGAAGFVGGTVLLKRTMDEVPPVQDTDFTVQVSRAPGGGVAHVGWKF